MNKLLRAALLVAMALACGCMSARTTDTARTAVEQLLLSTAADRAVKELDVDVLDGRKVFLDVSNVEAYDKGYVIDAIRDRLGRQGALFVDDAAKADVVVEARVGALAIDRSDTLFGMPALEIPVPFAGQVKSPEMALIKKISQEATAKIALHGRSRETGKQALSTTPQAGTAYYNRWWILFIAFKTTDIPEKQTTHLAPF